VARRAFVVLAIAVLTSGCTGSPPEKSMSEKCRDLFQEVETAKTRWQDARGTAQEDELRARFNQAQDRLFQSDCITL